MNDTATADLFAGPIFVQRGQSIVPRDSKGNARPLSRRGNPHTSVQAAFSAIGLASAHRTTILACLKLHNELTGHEIAERTGLSYQQVSKRTAELNEQGKIQRIAAGHQEDGTPIYWTRLSPAGRPCCVWQAK